MIAHRAHGGRSLRPADDRRTRPSATDRPARLRGPVPAPDTTLVEIRLDDPRRGDEIAVAIDRPSEPVDVRRLERRDLAERVASELAERELDRSRVLEGRARSRAKASEAGATQRTCRIGGPGCLGALPRRPPAGLTGERRAQPGTGRGAVARPDRLGRVEPACDRPRARWGRRAGGAGGARSLVRCPIRWTAVRRSIAPGTMTRRRLDPQVLIGRVDLGHPPGCASSLGRVVCGQVRVVLACQPTPGRLDLGLTGIGSDAQDGVRVARWHEPSVSTGGPPNPRAGPGHVHARPVDDGPATARRRPHARA